MKLILSIVAAFLVVSCSSSDKEVVRYKTTKSLPTLEIPPDLTALDDSQNKSLPFSSVGTKSAIARYKDSGELLDRVLPKLANMQLRGEGGFHWLEVDHDATEVYSLLKQFWAEEGFTLVKDEPLIGVMQTEWLENKAGLLFTEESFLSRMLSTFSSTDTQDQYHTRIERSLNGDKEVTNVYLAHKGKEFILLDSSDTVAQTPTKNGWQNRPNEPELEAEMLSRMMLFLGMQDDQVKAELAKLGQFPVRARMVKNENDQVTLVVMESFDRTWNRTLLNLDRLNAEYVSKDKSEGIIQIKHKSEKPKEEKGFFQRLFSSDESDEQETSIINIGLQETLSESTEIVIFTDANAKDNSDHALTLLQYLFERLK